VELDRKAYLELRIRGADEVPYTHEAAALRNYHLRSKKRKGWLFKREASMADILFPGRAPNDYDANERVFIYTESVKSDRSPLSFDYYDLPFCPAPATEELNFRRPVRRNLGNLLQGYNKKIAPFPNLHVQVDRGCTPLCTRHLNPKQVDRMREMIQQGYRVHLSLDHMPVLIRAPELNRVVSGFPIGFHKLKQDDKPLEADQIYLYNHLKFTVTYSYDDSDSYSGGIRITGFDVRPMSIYHKLVDYSGEISERSLVNGCQGGPLADDKEKYLALETRNYPRSGAILSVTYSYEIEWKAASLPWADRWDVYLLGAINHYLPIFAAFACSLMGVLFLSGLTALILIRTLGMRPTAGSLEKWQEEDQVQMEQLWKVVRSDVFHPPKTAPMALSVLVGSGSQVGLATTLWVLASMLQFFNPVERGQSLSAAIMLYISSAFVAGYTSSLVYNQMGGRHWEKNIFVTSMALPGGFLGILAVLDQLLDSVGAGTAASIATFGYLIFLMVCVAAPLVTIGAFFGIRRGNRVASVEINTVSRAIAPSPDFADARFTFLAGGALTFGSFFSHLLFAILTAWNSQFYNLTANIAASVFFATLTCACSSVITTYFLLGRGNHRWWWYSFWNTASTGVFYFAYSMWCMTVRLHLLPGLPTVIYVVYTAMISILVSVFCGSVGFLASFWLVKALHRVSHDAGQGMEKDDPLVVVIRDCDSSEELEPIDANAPFMKKDVVPSAAFVSFARHLFDVALRIRQDKQV
jgi:transmembrane 9 superfamily protein 2/4